jgi:membrane protein
MHSPKETRPSFIDRVQALYSRGRRFLLRDIWLLDLSAFSSGKSFVVRQLQVAVIVVRGFIDDQCLLRASALTYTTMLALVPMLAFMFAFLQGLGVQNLLEPLLVERLPMGSEETVHLILNFVKNIEVGTLGAIGLGSLLLTTLLQIGTVEQALNAIWGVTEGRTLPRKLTDYMSVLIIVPMALFLTMASTAALRNQALVAFLMRQHIIGDALVGVFSLLRYAMVWFALTFVYAYMPNTRVKLMPALIGGVVGGSLWQGAQWGYIEFQIGMAKYNAIYGALSQLPVLMFWLYVSWAIVLLGAELAFALQNATTYRFERFTPFTSVQVKERLALTLSFALIRAFTQNGGPWSAVAFGQQHRVPIRLLREVLETLTEAGLIVEAVGAPEHYVPGRDPAALTPWHILRAMRQHGDPAMNHLLAEHDSQALTVLQHIEEAEQHVAQSRSLTQWVNETAPTPESS